VHAGVEAPTKLEGFGDVLANTGKAVRKAFNDNVWMSADYVADMCAKVLAVCGNKLDVQEACEREGPEWSWKESVKRQMVRMHKALRLASNAAYETNKLDDNEYWDQQERYSKSVRLVAWLHQSMGRATVRALQRLFDPSIVLNDMCEKMKTITKKAAKFEKDALALALTAYLDAMRTYSTCHPQTFKNAVKSSYDEELRQEFEALVTVADRLEAVWDVGEERLNGIADVRRRVKRFENALRNAETSSQQEAGHINPVRLVAFVGETIYRDLLAFARALGGRTTQQAHYTIPMVCDALAWSKDPLAMALAKFLHAMERYKQRHEGDFMRAFSEDEIRLAEIGVENLDKSE
jgi:hypothetical protein